MDTVQAIARQAHGAPRKAKAAFDAQLEAAEGASSAGTIVAKAKAVSQNLFHSSGNLTEVVEASCGDAAVNFGYRPEKQYGRDVPAVAALRRGH